MAANLRNPEISSFCAMVLAKLALAASATSGFSLRREKLNGALQTEEAAHYLIRQQV
jgi:hypothetical protein